MARWLLMAAKRKRGYMLPTPITGWDLICVTLKIPDVSEYRSAFRGQLKGLTEWWNFERPEEGLGNIEAADYWRQIIHEHLIIQDCDELAFLGCDNMAQFDICEYYDSLGIKRIKYTLNGGCTWKTVELCSDSQVPTEPVIPVVPPIDNPGLTPDPIEFSETTRCRVLFGTMYTIIITRLGSIFTSVINGSPTSRSYNLSQWLDGLEDSSNGLQWFPVFKIFVEQYVPFITEINAVFESAIFGDHVCNFYSCVPRSGVINRDVLNCIGDYYKTWGEGQGGDEEILGDFISDFLKIYPLAVARADAFRDAINTEIDISACAACAPAPGDCDPVLVTFDVGGADHTVNVGTLFSTAVEGQGLRLVSIPSTSLIPDFGLAQFAWGAKVTIPLANVCSINKITYRGQAETDPHLNANNHGFGLVWRLQVYNGAALVRDQVFADLGIDYYWVISTNFLTWGRDFSDDPIVGDSIVLSWEHGHDAGYASVIYRIDNILVEFAES